MPDERLYLASGQISKLSHFWVKFLKEIVEDSEENCHGNHAQCELPHRSKNYRKYQTDDEILPVSLLPVRQKHERIHGNAQ